MSDPFADRRAAFGALHERGCFVIPNPWDIGSAVFLEHLGFSALATSSAGFAFTRGLPDSPTALGLKDVLAHTREIVGATDLPVNVDFQAGYADGADGVAEHVGLCVETGASGLSIEDATGDASEPLYALGEAADRIRAARAAIDASGSGVLLTGRAECFLVGHPEPKQESIRRLIAYADAGADVLFAPGMTDPSHIRELIDAVAPKPVNVLISSPAELTVAQIAELGARRISVGSALARAAWGGFLAAARELAEHGTFGGLRGAASFGELNTVFDARVKD